MADKGQTDDKSAVTANVPGAAGSTAPGGPATATPAASVTPPRRGPGHRGADVRDTMAELAAKAQEISQEAGSRMASTMRDVIHAAAGMASFTVESARDLVQYMVRRGQISPEQGEQLLREAEEGSRKSGASSRPSTRPTEAKAPPRPEPRVTVAAEAPPAPRPAAAPPKPTAAVKPAAPAKTASRAAPRTRTPAKSGKNATAAKSGKATKPAKPARAATRSGASKAKAKPKTGRSAARRK